MRGIGLQVFKVQGLKPLHGKIKVQGAKNAVLPMMAVSLLTEGRTEIRNVPRISDVFLMAEILRDLGCQVMFQDDVLEIDASGLSGTVISEKTVGRCGLPACFWDRCYPGPGGDDLVSGRLCDRKTSDRFSPGCAPGNGSRDT